MNVVPTRATRFLGDRMIRDALHESGADAVLRNMGECQVGQVAALLGYVLDHCQPLEIVVEPKTVEPVVEVAPKPPASERMVYATLRDVCDAYPVTVDQLLGRRGDRSVSEARHVAMWLLRQAGMTYPAIGSYLGRDHTTVMYGVSRVDRDENLQGIAASIQQWSADAVEVA